MSKEQTNYLKKIKKNKLLIRFIQLIIIIVIISIWELLSYKKIINSFIFSSPSLILKTIINLVKDNNLFIHIFITLKETIIAFVLGITLGLSVAIILYSNKIVAKTIEPFLTLLNSLPKVALGPIIIIWIGANNTSIIVMALLINLVVSILTIYNGFLSTDKYKINLLKSFKATKIEILRYLIIPSSYSNIISSLKLNISLTLIGVIMGEFLVSKNGIGYLIMYGTQVFNLNLVMAGIVILLIISTILYNFVSYIEKKLLK